MVFWGEFRSTAGTGEAAHDNRSCVGLVPYRRVLAVCVLFAFLGLKIATKKCLKANHKNRIFVENIL